jgi:hypothetical protein
MRLRIPLLLSASFLVAVALASAQGPGGKEKKSFGKAGEPAGDPVARMMEFDKNKDGKLTKEEVTDKRLHALFDRADANKDGFVTPEELKALFEREALPAGGFGPGDGPPKKGDFGEKKGGFGEKKGGFGFGGGFGPPRPGEILPSFLQSMLKLTDEQKQQVGDLQKEVDRKLDKILTDEQRETLQKLRDAGPGGFGPPPGFPTKK